jgi:hypothetical protein
MVDVIAEALSSPGCFFPEPDPLKEITAAHDVWRYAQDVTPLNWCDDLATAAQSRVDQLASTGCDLATFISDFPQPDPLPRGCRNGL